jgi:WD40 repeat protein
MITLLLLAQITAANAGQIQQTASAHDAKSAILCLAFSPDGKLLAAGEVDKKIRLYEAATGKQVALLQGHTKQVAAVAFSPDGATLFSASYDYTVRRWDVASGKQKEVQAGDLQKGEVPDVDDMRALFNKDVTLLAYGAYERLWNLGTKKQVVRNSLVVHGWFDFSSDGSTLLSVCGSDKETSAIRNFERWDVRAGKALARWAGTAGAAYERVALSGDGARAAAIDVGGDDNKWKLEIWSVADRKRVLAPGFHPDSVNGMAFTKDGSAVATASLDKTIKVWDAASGKELKSLAHPVGFMGLAFSADGARMATGDGSGGIQVWGLK